MRTFMSRSASQSAVYHMYTPNDYYYFRDRYALCSITVIQNYCILVNSHLTDLGRASVMERAQFRRTYRSEI
jgi:hypothetical protein